MAKTKKGVIPPEVRKERLEKALDRIPDVPDSELSNVQRLNKKTLMRQLADEKAREMVNRPVIVEKDVSGGGRGVFVRTKEGDIPVPEGAKIENISVEKIGGETRVISVMPPERVRRAGEVLQAIDEQSGGPGNTRITRTAPTVRDLSPSQLSQLKQAQDKEQLLRTVDQATTSTPVTVRKTAPNVRTVPVSSLQQSPELQQPRPPRTMTVPDFQALVVGGVIEQSQRPSNKIKFSEPFGNAPGTPILNKKQSQDVQDALEVLYRKEEEFIYGPGGENPSIKQRITKGARGLAYTLPIADIFVAPGGINPDPGVQAEVEKFLISRGYTGSALDVMLKEVYSRRVWRSGLEGGAFALTETASEVAGGILFPMRFRRLAKAGKILKPGFEGALQRFAIGFPISAGFGFVEGASQEFIQEKSRMREISPSDILISGGLGSLTAGTFQGAIFASAPAPTVRKGVEFTGQALDFPYEGIGDLFGSTIPRFVRKTIFKQDVTDFGFLPVSKAGKVITLPFSGGFVPGTTDTEAEVMTTLKNVQSGQKKKPKKAKTVSTPNIQTNLPVTQETNIDEVIKGGGDTPSFVPGDTTTLFNQYGDSSSTNITESIANNTNTFFTNNFIKSSTLTPQPNTPILPFIPFLGGGKGRGVGSGRGRKGSRFVNENVLGRQALAEGLGLAGLGLVASARAGPPGKKKTPQKAKERPPAKSREPVSLFGIPILKPQPKPKKKGKKDEEDERFKVKRIIGLPNIWS